MFDQSFTYKTISSLITKSDFAKNPDLIDKNYKSQIVNSCIEKSLIGFTSSIDVAVNQFKGKPVYKVKLLQDELLLRKASENIKRITSVKQQDRDSIVNNLICFLREGVSYNIYKLDIKSFYESIDTVEMLKNMKNDITISKPTIRVIETILKNIDGSGLKGLPRGLQLSATLSELIMRKFDNYCQKHNDIFFFSRYVDDIIIITSALEEESEFINNLETKIYRGLKFNSKKTDIINIPVVNKNDAEKEFEKFKYLGYEFTIKNPSKKNIREKYRDVFIDISSKKVKKIKTRIIRAFLSFCENKDYDLLKDRIKLITGNYSIIDRKSGVKRKAGIFYSYNHVSIETSSSIKDLDIFLKKALLSRNNKISNEVNNILSLSERRRLLKISFSNGFKRKVFFHFPQQRLAKIMQCWAYE
ncbi:MAG: antiviral reverse transcriptase Drt3a [Candidatus Electrothrix sp. YB6]